MWLFVNVDHAVSIRGSVRMDGLIILYCRNPGRDELLPKLIHRKAQRHHVGFPQVEWLSDFLSIQLHLEKLAQEDESPGSYPNFRILGW